MGGGGGVGGVGGGGETTRSFSLGGFIGSSQYGFGIKMHFLILEKAIPRNSKSDRLW
jgi:hypothetical protein